MEKRIDEISIFVLKMPQSELLHSPNSVLLLQWGVEYSGFHLMGMIQNDFLGFGKFGKYCFVWLDLSRDFFVYYLPLLRSSANKTQSK